MKQVLIMVMVILLVTAVMLSFPVIRQWGYEFDAHGHFISPDGTIQRESISERNFFSLLLSVLLLFITSLYYFTRKKSLVQR